MRRNREPHSLGRREVQVRAMEMRNEDNQILLVVAYVLASALIVLWVAYLASITNTILTSWNVAPQRLTSNEIVIHLNKADRLARKKFDDRWNAISISTTRKLLPARSIGQVPVGCEGAFSRLVKDGNFSTRCIATGDMLTRLASLQ